ncbi:MAG TPA: trimeric intracellular cation channel family protein [Kiritimatiellia bacterium]|nr:trimeric intracellular cation channel family protein [Kiritimatiellia bacterium]
MTLIYILSLCAIAVFAMSGALTAGRKKFDVFGVLVVAVATAIGGGTIRDLLLDRNPIFWIADTNYLAVASIAAGLTVIYTRFHRPPVRLLTHADTIGMAWFTISGARIAESVGVSPGVCVLMGCITGVAGGVIRDIFCGETPMLLRDRELYATAAIAGAALYLLLYRRIGLDLNLSVLAGVLLIILLRTGALHLKLRMPVYRLGPPSAP